KSMEDGLNGVSKGKRAEVRIHGAEISRQPARGAVHIADDKPVDSGQLAAAVVTGVVEASTRAGADPRDAILGASQGVIQGTVETHGDLLAAAAKTIETAKELAIQSGVPEKLAATEAVEGALQAAESIGSEAVARVKEAIPAADLKK
ncbi:MAG: hypothetical protein PHQ43_10580, partial [Dehalococcoidales bacterium]|nr:hypothetical protein [Dehalococcoidales bacterium]